MHYVDQSYRFDNNCELIMLYLKAKLKPTIDLSQGILKYRANRDVRCWRNVLYQVDIKSTGLLLTQSDRL